MPISKCKLIINTHEYFPNNSKHTAQFSYFTTISIITQALFWSHIAWKISTAVKMAHERTHYFSVIFIQKTSRCIKTANHTFSVCTNIQHESFQFFSREHIYRAATVLCVFEHIQWCYEFWTFFHSSASNRLSIVYFANAKHITIIPILFICCFVILIFNLLLNFNWNYQLLSSWKNKQNSEEYELSTSDKFMRFFRILHYYLLFIILFLCYRIKNAVHNSIIET